jgi:hypothetical protein
VWASISRFILLIGSKFIISFLLKRKYRYIGELSSRHVQRETSVIHSRLSCYFLAIQSLYALLKFIFALAFENYNGWFWGCLSVTIVGTVLEFVAVRKLAVPFSRMSLSVNDVEDLQRDEDSFTRLLEAHRQARANRGVGGRLKFTDDAIKKGRVPKTGVNKSAAFMRLLQFSAPDKALLFMATVCLTGGAVSSTSLPHFTGECYHGRY